MKNDNRIIRLENSPRTVALSAIAQQPTATLQLIAELFALAEAHNHAPAAVIQAMIAAYEAATNEQ